MSRATKAVAIGYLVVIVCLTFSVIAYVSARGPSVVLVWWLVAILGATTAACIGFVVTSGKPTGVDED